MQRLPNIYPSNTTLYPNGRGTIALPSNNAGTKVVMYNETPLNYDLDFLNGTSDVLHAWEANYWTLDGNVDEIDWQIDVDSLNVTSPPINAIFLTIYEPNETLRDKTYPMALVRQLGGPAQLTSSNSLVNTGNPGGTSIINVNDPIASTITADNDGQLTWLVKVGAALVQFLKSSSADNPLLALGAAAHLVEILGNAKVDGMSTLTGGATIGAAGILAAAAIDLALNANTGQKISLRINGGNEVDVDTTGINLTRKKVNDGAAGNLADWTAGGLYLKGNPTNHGPLNFQGDGTHTDFQLIAFNAIGFTTVNGTTAAISHGLQALGVATVPTGILAIAYTTGVSGANVTIGISEVSATTFKATSIAAVPAIAFVYKIG